MTNQTATTQAPDAAICLEPPPYPEPSSIPLLDKAESFPQGWPKAPEPVKASVVSVALGIGVDLVLFLLSLTFLAFALAVQYYDELSIRDYPRTTGTLLEAAKYVRVPKGPFLRARPLTHVLGTQRISDPLRKRP